MNDILNAMEEGSRGSISDCVFHIFSEISLILMELHT
jgi:hypothetical protein